ncbi:MAG: MucB/RseB C-terminal domain-containing protein [Limnobacter sp.]|uniref:MucB/RseB C-terminal domain-containing protein n=1 Tax=Limnobacter sp. TaxID=2003368 RepID=UPI00391C2AAE
MIMSALRVSLSAGVLALVTLVAPAHAQPDLWVVLLQSQEQAKALNYSGLLLNQSGEFSQSSKLHHQVTQTGEFEVLERLDGQPARWIRQNDEIQCVLPDRKLVLTERRQSSASLFPRLTSLKDSISELDKLYTISELPSRRVAGRSSRVIQLKPRDDMRYEYRFYLDRQKSLLMRTELYSSRGDLLEHVGFTEIDFEPDETLKPEKFPAGQGWRTATTEVVPVKDAELAYSLPDILAGFKRASTLCRIKGSDKQVQQTVFSDGLSSLSVFVQRAPDGQAAPTAPMSHGAVNSKSEVQSQHRVTVMGEVPEKTINLFMKSVRWKSQ